MCKKFLSLTVIACFFLNSLGPLPKAQADSVLGLPLPGTMIERVRREGVDSLSPVIFKITPITSIWPLVGLQAAVG